MTRYFLALTLSILATGAVQAQEGPTPTQTIIQVDSKAPVLPTTSNVMLKVNDRATPLTSISLVKPGGAQVALLIDDGLRLGVGRNLDELRSFLMGLPSGTEVMVGYMRYGGVTVAQNFTTDHAAAANALRLPQGTAGVNASPYFCLSSFVKSWPSGSERQVDLQQTSRPEAKARFVLMITNGVDPYNGSTSMANQDSPYVSAAITDAQRAGVPVYSIYYSDAGWRGGRSSFSGQSYLQQVADATGGTSFYQGSLSPVSLTPFLDQFKKAVSESYVATFTASGNKDLVRINVKTNLAKTKLRAPQLVRPGNTVSATAE
ncbi:hypothetical protein GCM10011507_12150 [Edaphobacter acidisoli]|uniref:VWFA-related domain-containing protein n=1 Tax=Edaphobacter acidisoli TaxID=2040573 RepID=A0A916RMY7_9BACT|nr:hypothetical protein [Edaphobacter acidisoli]GGA62199.1 hypothetical protein GCM10011507_12150 [Edaphobacter acidisoli]